ncbi:hypothetical protein [Methylomagnum sp.]
MNESETSRRQKTLKPIWRGRPVEVEFGYQRRDGKKSFRRVLLSKVLEDDSERLFLLGFCSKRQRDRVFSMEGLTTNIRFHGENYSPEEFVSEMLIGGKAAFVIKEDAAESSEWSWPMLAVAATVVLMALGGGGYWYFGMRGAASSPEPGAGLTASTPESNASPPPSAMDTVETRIPVVDDSTVNDFIYRFALDYTDLGTKLLQGYYRFEKNHDFDGFETFKTMEWLPEYQAKQMYYNAVQERNWEYMFYHGLTQLTTDFLEMIPSSNDLWFVLKNLDDAKLAVVRNRFLRVKSTLEELDKKRNLNLGQVLGDFQVR